MRPVGQRCSEALNGSRTKCGARLYLASRAKHGMHIPARWAGCEMQSRATQINSEIIEDL